jgi:hypothetical protein
MEDPTGWCQHCGGTFRYRLVHNGFGNTAYAYCGNCSFTVLLGEWSQAAKRVPFQSQRRISPDLEPLLKPCPCGGNFFASAEPRCPNCAHPLSAIEATNYIEKNAPGTARGWRWDQSWSGVYSIAINNNVVEDWWDDDAVARVFPNVPGQRGEGGAAVRKPWWKFW